MEIKKELTEDLRKKALAGLAVIVALVLLSPIIADQVLLQEEKITFPASANVTPPANNSSEQVGLKAGSNNLSYGRITVENNETRFIQLTAEKKTSFTLKASGNISEYLAFDSKHYYNGTNNISVEFRPEKVGYYEGKLSIKAVYPKMGLGARWLEIKQ